MIGVRKIARWTSLVLWVGGSIASGQDCSQTSIGETPISELTGTYQGFSGGLYPGSNLLPAGHQTGGLVLGDQIVPRDASGQPDGGGQIVMISIGMSNTTQEFSRFIPLANADPDKDPRLTIVDTAQGGQDARRIADPNAQYWQTVLQRLQQAGVTADQVQVAWLKEAVARPTADFPEHAEELRDLLGTIVQIAHDLFPNLRQVYLSSRIYAGYATTTLNPEPFAYESGFSVRWVIERQIQGDPNLNYDPQAGPVEAPWLAWGPYTWADGLTPRADGLIWECSDFEADGTHPGPTAETKVAEMLLEFFKSDPVARAWFRADGGPCSNRARLQAYGSGTNGTLGEPQITIEGLATLPGQAVIRVDRARPQSGVIHLLGFAPDQVPAFGGIVLVGNPIIFSSTSNGNGRTVLNLGALPPNPSFCGINAYTQAVVVDPQGPTGVFAFTRGLRVLLGR